ncbi:hypothetical protein FOPG_12655 [Fusarium oxysporum f. sp. conglutinans race 2 54008]|uniref:Adenosine deaminase domain-containing protein n=1 Tax=Fusarium oxysporum f. sp. conglutinans race 2 54008 TaxID=1089457 RepID=X0H604_FUSOX|nr:hypothetical protein FOPG_12655 [Fusarium oxysporum f. sp. conglutinans race 2 54008]
MRPRIDKLGLDLPFIFHAGETQDHGGDTDTNLFEAILLGTKRIGYGFSIVKHPLLMQLCLRVIAEWSIEHSCMSSDMQEKVYKDFEEKRFVFCQWIIDTYGQQWPAEPEIHVDIKALADINKCQGNLYF